MVDKRDSFDQIYLEMSVHRGSDVTFKTTKVKKVLYFNFSASRVREQKSLPLDRPSNGPSPVAPGLLPVRLQQRKPTFAAAEIW